MSKFIDHPIEISIDRIREISNLDIGSSAEFRAFVSIDGRRIRGRKHNGDDVKPFERFSNTNGEASGIVPIKIELFEEDRGSDTRVDINPRGGRDLNLAVNLSTGEILDADNGFQVLGQGPQPITLRGASGKRVNGEITFRVFAGINRDPENSILVQGPILGDQPESNDQLGSSFNGTNRVITGDFNDDGRADLVFGSKGDDTTHVVFGTDLGLRRNKQLFDRSNIGIAINGEAHAVGDFNGDNVDDLALGSNGEGAAVVSGRFGLGLVGSPQIITRSPDLAPQNNIIFGATLAAADFNGDGFDDLATADPSAFVSRLRDGAVQINYGSSFGITNNGRQFFTRNTPGILGGYETFVTNFGHAMAAGDFNGDGFDDLVIGVPFGRDSAPDAGVVHILYGSSTGLQANGSQIFGQFFGGVTDRIGDEFGRNLAVGDIDGNGVDDLVVGAPGRDNDAGAIYVYRGQIGQLLPVRNPQILDQDKLGQASISGDRFGSSLDIADVDRDGFDDIAIGISGNRNGSTGTPTGAAMLVFGRSFGVSTNTRLFFEQGDSGVAGTPETGDGFGSSVAIGNFNGSGAAELAVSSPFDDFGTVTNAGLINIISVESKFPSSFSSTIQSSRSGSKKDDILRGNHVNGLLDGGDGDDKILTLGGDDIAVGGDGDDSLRGGGGHDALIGGPGNDRLVGGPGDDILDGGEGNNIYLGKWGRDIFGIAQGHGRDRIHDFQDGVDLIGLSNGLLFEELNLEQRGKNTIVSVGDEALAILRGVGINQLEREDFIQLEYTQFEGIRVPTIEFGA